MGLPSLQPHMLIMRMLEGQAPSGTREQKSDCPMLLFSFRKEGKARAPRNYKVVPSAFQDTPKMVQAGPKSSRDGPRWPKVVPTWLQDAPRWSNDGRKWCQHGSKMPRDDPMMAQPSPKWSQNGPWGRPGVVLGSSWGRPKNYKRYPDGPTLSSAIGIV